MKLREQTVVVTGANGAMGSVLVETLKGRARHVVGCLHVEAADPRDGSDGFGYVACDLTDRAAVKAAVADIVRARGTFHAWINVAGGFAADGRVEDLSPVAWRRQYRLNFLTCLNGCHAALAVFHSQNFGRLINFGSLAGEKGLAGAGPYAVSKAAVHSLTLSLALEGSREVTANLIVPSTIDTPANRRAMPGADFASWTQPGIIAAKVAELLDESDDPPNGEKIFV